MPDFTIIIRTPNGQPTEGTVRGDTLGQAIEHAKKMGHDVDEPATRTYEKSDASRPGRAATITAFLLALGAWAFIEMGLAAVICAVIALESSKGRRGLAALAFSLSMTLAGIAFWYLQRIR